MTKNMTGNVGMVGHAPTVLIRPAKDTPVNKNRLKKQLVNGKISGEDVAKLLDISDECQKYLKVWNVPAYRVVSPGEDCVEMFLEAVEDMMPDHEDQTLIDFGCGTGRAAMKLDETFKVTPMDFAWNCLDENVKQYFGDRFIEHDITQKTKLRANWGFTTDVMEHLPPDEIDDALDTILEACENVFFQIATVKDHFGGHPDIKDELHLSVLSYAEWLKKFAEHGVVVHRSLELKQHVIFLVSGYQGFAFDKMKMNTSEDIVFSQIRTNLEKGIQQLRPFVEQSDQKVIVLGGSPSLNDYIDEIKEHKKNGAKIITMNGSYLWAKEHDLWPVTQFMIDARKFNERFVEPVDDNNIYIMASQIHPDLLDKLPPERTYLFQANCDPRSTDICKELVGEMYKDWFPIPGGSTVMLRCLPALQMMGFRSIEIFGFDSCFMNDREHHAYDQPENDITEENINRVGLITNNGKTFAVDGWMICQAKEFMDIRQRLVRKLDIKVHGDGLIAHCLETGFDIIEE